MAKRSSKAQKSTVRAKQPSSSKATKSAKQPAVRRQATQVSSSKGNKPAKSAAKTAKPAKKAAKPVAPKAAAKLAEVKPSVAKAATKTEAATKTAGKGGSIAPVPHLESVEPPSQARVALTPPATAPAEPPEAPQVPSRAPTRKVFGPDNKVITLSERRQAAGNPPPTETPEVEDPIEISLSAPIKREVDLPSLHELFPTKGSGAATKRAVDLQAVPSFPTATPSAALPKAPLSSQAAVDPAPGVGKVSWSKLPITLSKELKTELGVIASHCASAASSPFPFAKFLAVIPQELCALQFAALLLETSFDDAPEVNAKKIGVSTAQFASLLSDGSSALSELFASHCATMYRSWKAQLVGRVVSAKTLVEHHLIHSIDKEFQQLISRVILCSFGVKSGA